MAITSGFDFLIQWHLTEKCNLRCKHCYQTGSIAEEMPLRDIKRAVDEVSDTISDWSDFYNIEFQPSMNLTGGEPFLFNHFFDVLEYIVTKGFDVSILSNGILVNAEKARRISNLGVKEVQISVEGPEDIHDSIRGAGSFVSSITGVNHLLNAGIQVTLNTTLSDINADHFLDMIEFAASVGVHRLGFSRLVPSGKGEKMIGNILPTERVQELYRSIQEINDDRIIIVTGDPVATQMSLSKDDIIEDGVPFGGCAAGVSGITVLSDGTLVPCRRMHVPIGNIRTDSFREIWASSPVILKLRNKENYSGKCARCTRWSSCRGCRAIAYSLSRFSRNGDMLAEDPQCFIAD